MIGILALQGSYQAHGDILSQLGQDIQYVRKPNQLEKIDALIIPGGESTTLVKLMHTCELWYPLKAFASEGKPILGTCAGMIVLAKEVRSPSQDSLGLIDIRVERNSYGRQVESFETLGTFQVQTQEWGIPMVFIRAPRILEMGPEVQTLARYQGDCVAARQNNVLVAAFHPELTRDHTLIHYFLKMI